MKFFAVLCALISLPALAETVQQTTTLRYGRTLGATYEIATPNYGEKFNTAGVLMCDGLSGLRVDYSVVSWINGAPESQMRIESKGAVDLVKTDGKCEAKLPELAADSEDSVSRMLVLTSLDRGNAAIQNDGDGTPFFALTKTAGVAFRSMNASETVHLYKLLGMETRELRTSNFDKITLVYKVENTGSNKPASFVYYSHVLVESSKSFASLGRNGNVSADLFVQETSSFTPNPEIHQITKQLQCSESHERHNFGQAVCLARMDGFGASRYAYTIEHFLRVTVNGEALIDPIRQSEFFNLMNL